MSQNLSLLELSGAFALDELIVDARRELCSLQQADGHFVFAFEADATIPAEYVLLLQYLGESRPEIEAKLAAYLRRIQGDHDGWPLFHEGDFNISASVKAYFALKMVGDDPDAAHMRRAREAILAHGGAAQCNVFTRITLALFGQVPWRAVPVMPVEIMLLPRWFPFHISKISYWSRTVLAPLLILMALKPRARNPRGVGIEELFCRPAEREDYPMNATGSLLGSLFVGLDSILRRVEPVLPSGPRGRAIKASLDFFLPRMNGEDGLGGIFPAMANAVMALDTLGYDREDPVFKTAREAIDKLLLLEEEEGTCQPCLSPVWDTALAAHALMEAGLDAEDPEISRALDWMIEREITETEGDWSWQRPGVAPAGWPFQYRNDYYPDVDDTAVVAMALERAKDPRYRPAVERAAAWIEEMQSKNGGWGSFDADNTASYLNHIPFADHGALLDPPTVDVSARCIGLLAQLGYDRDYPAIRRGLEYLRREQEADGSWFGRWGTNYVYGTWSALSAFNAAGEDLEAPHIRKAVAWLKERQREDGGWGEDGATYWKERRAEAKASTPSQTAWALLGLMAAGEVDSPEAEQGIAYLENLRRQGARWDEEHYTAVGFPRVFYLKYYGYAAYFPLWALARYRNLKHSNARQVRHGI